MLTEHNKDGQDQENSSGTKPGKLKACRCSLQRGLPSLLQLHTFSMQTMLKERRLKTFTQHCVTAHFMSISGQTTIYLWWASRRYFFMATPSMLAGRAAKFCRRSLHEVVIFNRYWRFCKKRHRIVETAQLALCVALRALTRTLRRLPVTPTAPHVL